MKVRKNVSLFIDRDGVINKLVEYGDDFDSPRTQNDVTLVDGISKIIKWANDSGILVVEISNQPGVAKGKMSKKTSDAIEQRVHKLLEARDAMFDKSYICPHHPEGVVPELSIECDCRKPKPGLLEKAAKELNIDLKKSIFLVDKATDVEAGRAVECKTIIFLHKDDMSEKVRAAEKANADYKVKKLEEVIPIIKEVFEI